MLEMKSSAKEEQHKSAPGNVNSSSNLGDEKLTIENVEDESQ
jgi:hypothetical protein